VSPGAGLLQPEESLDFNLDIDLIPNFLEVGVSPTGMDGGMSDADKSNSEIKLESPIVRVYSSDKDV
jgi:hypothetical protein